MQVTVRTLDSRSETFEIDEEVAQCINVKGFKEFIEVDLDVPAERQRLIFKGKVLQDDKPLMSYGVDGNVVHLVERPPPSETRPSSIPTESSRSGPQTNSGNADGSPNVYIGGIYGSGDVNQITQQLVENLLSSLGAGAQANVTTSTSENGSTVDVQIAVQSLINVQSSPNQDSDDEARGRLRQSRRFLKDAVKVLEEGGVQNSADQDAAGETSSSSERDETADLSNTPEALAAVLDRLLEFNRDIQPMLERYRDILKRTDGSPSPDDDHVPDDVAEIFHNLSHALHALSDLSINLHTPHPRHLTVFPRLSPLDMPMPQSFVSSANTGPTGNTQSTSGPGRNAAPPFTGLSFTRPPPRRPAAPSSSSSTTSTPSGSSSGTGTPDSNSSRVGRTVVGIVTEVPCEPTMTSSSTRSNISGTTAGSTSQSTTSATTTGVNNMGNNSGSRPIFSLSAGPRPFSFYATTSQVFSNLNQGGRQRFLIPGMFPTVRLPSSMSQGPSNPSNTSSTSNASRTTTATNAASGTTSSTTTDSTAPGTPFRLSSIPIPGIQPSSQHPDPLLPCQSFHFGPSFQQWRPEPLSGVNLGPGSNLGSMTSSAHTSSRVNTPATETGQSTASTSRAASGMASTSSATDDPRMPAFEGIPGMPTRDMFNDFIQSCNNVQSTMQMFRDGSTGTNESDDFGSIFESVMRSFISGGMNQSIRELWETVSGHEEHDEDDVLYGFLDVIGSFSGLDFIGLMTGTTVEPLNRVKPQLREFIEKYFNQGNRLTVADINRVVEDIGQRIKPFIKMIVSQVKVKENYDLESILQDITRPFLTRILTSLAEDSSSFGSWVVTVSRGYCAVMVGATDRTVIGGFDEFGKSILSRDSFHYLLGDASIQDVFSERSANYLIPMLRSVASRGGPPDAYFETFLPRYNTRRRENEPTPSTSPMQIDTPKASSVEDSPAERKPIDVNEVWKERMGSAADGESNDLGGDDTSKPEEWNHHVPKEWIPIISKDVKRQRSARPRQPSSDAYLSGLPPKRRKALKRYSDEDVDVLGLLQDSVAQAKVTPETSVSEIAKDSRRINLTQSFQEQVQHDIRQRLNNDHEYGSKRFPNSDKHFKPEEDQR